MKSKLILIFSFLVSFLNAQHSVHIEGTVLGKIDEETNQPLFNATVFLKNADSGAFTDEQGRFMLMGDFNLPDTLIIRAMGYYSDTVFIRKGEKHLNVQVLLYPDHVLEEVVIEAKRENSSVLRLDPRNTERLSSGELRKAACCNLSESFETNATVDVNLSDGVSGSKRIAMMGLNGRYTQIQFENIPIMHNLDQAFGLSAIPGTWIESIQITKGTGTVVNGYESMVGLINLEYRKPDDIERLYFNAYGNIQGRAEVNLHGGKEFKNKLSSAWFVHGSSMMMENDRNNDGFNDMPTGQEFVAMNRWKYKGELFRAQLGFKANYADKVGGQLGYSRDLPSDTDLYGVGIKSLHLEAFGKTGFLFENKPFSSIGVVYFAKYHELNTRFGNRTLDGTEKRGYVNFMYETILGSTMHTLKSGASFIYDDLDQQMEDDLEDGYALRNLIRTEMVPGVYSEYTYAGMLTTVVLGMRMDYHNLFGMQYTPRANMKYAFSENMDIRLTAGRGFRVSNFALDNLSLMATNTPWQVSNNIKPEVSWNFGASWYYEFKMFDRKASWTLDYYHTFFENQLIADRDEDPNLIIMDNLEGQSFSNAFQTDLKFKPLMNFEIKMAYKFLDVRATMGGQLMEKIMVPRHRGFVNLGYITRNKRWELDFTASVFGPQRLATVYLPDGTISQDNESETVPMLAAQVTHVFKKFDLYIGGENLLDYRLRNPIIDVENPFGNRFDATRVYAPIYGINIYVGIRMSIDKKKND
ncbi:MAG: TonB-dependent receptor [Brumimicrobium sp.]|nr:TonB-dependent receptor [Brumimicrobium sp.]